MYSIIFIVISLATFNLILGESDIEKLTVNEVANNLVAILDETIADGNTTKPRITELNEKLNKINSYVVDKDKFAELLKNESKDNTLNETEFFNALEDNDNFRFLLDNNPKNLYLRLKEKMNRDDILNVIDKKESNSGRKVMGTDMFGKNGEEAVDEVVDRMIGEIPKDDHKYEDETNGGVYWDPQAELEELHDHHQHDGRRIYRGERTTIRYYPFVVSIHVMGRFWCGGSIYWHDLIITSAACLQLMHNNRFFRENPRVLEVRVGSNHSRISGEMIPALEVFFHPSYNPRTLRNNIAVIRLRRHLKFTYHRTPKCIDISHSQNPPAPTAEVLVLGWGVTKMSQRLSFEPIFLQRKVLPIYPNLFCKEVYGEKFITDTMFCAGSFTTGEGACDHDAGGPAIIGGKLVGIISFGPTVCGYPNAPTVFTLIGAFADWLETINETMPTYHRGKVRTTTTTEFPFYKYTRLPLPEEDYDMGSPTPYITIGTGTPTLQTGLPGLRMGSDEDFILSKETFATKPGDMDKDENVQEAIYRSKDKENSAKYVVEDKKHKVKKNKGDKDDLFVLKLEETNTSEAKEDIAIDKKKSYKVKKGIIAGKKDVFYEKSESD